VSSTLADADGLGTLTYRWQSSADGSQWTDIAGASGNSFTPGEAQVGLKLRVLAGWTDGRGTVESATSAASTAVANLNDAPTGSVKLAGTAEQGQLLSASNQLADADGLGTIRYEWQSSSDGSQWSAIAGASGASFTLGLAQVGLQVRALARWTDGHGSNEAVASPASTSVLGRQTGGSGADTLTGTAFVDRLDGGNGNDRLQGNGGNDQLHGDAASTAPCTSARAPTTRSPIAPPAVQALAGDEGRDTLDQVERLVFSDQSLAFDLDGAAGSTARILGAVFGREAVANPVFVGIGLSLLDQGSSLDALMQLALDARLGAGFSAAAEVQLLFQNLIGSGPSARTRLLDRRPRGRQLHPGVAGLDGGEPGTQRDQHRPRRARRRGSAQRGAHRVDHGLVVGLAEDRAAGHEGVGAGVGHAADVVDLDAAVDLEPDVAPAGVDELARLLDLAQRAVDEALAAEAGVDAHDQHQVDLVDHPLQHVQRRRRVEHQPGLLAFGLDQLQRAVHVRAGVGVEAHQVGAGLAEGLRQRIHRLHHQVHVDRHAGMCLRSAWQTIGPKVRLGT
jgi:hypothetical protein